MKTIIYDHFIQILKKVVSLNHPNILTIEFIITHKSLNHLNSLQRNLSALICTFRCSNHRLSAEKDRFWGVYRNQHFCFCNIHVIQMLYYRQTPNTSNYESLMTSTDTNSLTRFAAYL